MATREDILKRKMEADDREIERLEQEWANEQKVAKALSVNGDDGEHDAEANGDDNEENAEALEFDSDSLFGTREEETTEEDDGAAEQNDEDDEDAVVDTKQNGKWEKRYKDAQRYISDLQKENKQLKAASKEAKLPVDPDKMKEWMDRNPIALSIVRKLISEENAPVREQVDSVSKKISRQEAEYRLEKLHPDFRSIRENRHFHKWVENQNNVLKEIIYAKNDFDVNKIAWVLDLYKDLKDARGEPNRKDKETSKAVVTKGHRSSTSLQSPRKSFDFKESEINQMSAREFEENEEAINQASRNGRILYDLTKS